MKEIHRIIRNRYGGQAMLVESAPDFVIYKVPHWARALEHALMDLAEAGFNARSTEDTDDRTGAVWYHIRVGVPA